ncbi:MAG TPA: ThuA domain-containing protein [Isosphaeraceae bacterium]|jgi:type 1 glutamine amidotransferase|nr:ThuA domain-containing protein [Isosphaeraceae bacterium]
MKTMFAMLSVLGLSLVSAPAAQAKDDAKAKVVVVAGRPSHGPREHEFNAGCKLLVKCLNEQEGVEAVFVGGGWPSDEGVFEGAKSVVFFMDGGGGHPMIQSNRLETMKRLMDRGVGLVCLHYAVEFPKGKAGDQLLDWLGGYYEAGYSTNPHWTAEVKSLPDHPITRGVKPFTIKDEWYFNIRFRPDMKGVTPIVVAKPDDKTRQGVSASPRGPYAHIVAAKGRDEVLGWSTVRADGGRSFGFTGAHFHDNWGQPDFRKLVLNAILWTARVDVPKDGVACEVSKDDLEKNLDPKGRR